MRDFTPSRRGRWRLFLSLIRTAPEMFGSLPAYALYARHVVGLTVSNWQVQWTQPDLRAVFDDVSGLKICGWRAAASATLQLQGFRNVGAGHVEDLMAGPS